MGMIIQGYSDKTLKLVKKLNKIEQEKGEAERDKARDKTTPPVGKKI